MMKFGMIGEAMHEFCKRHRLKICEEVKAHDQQDTEYFDKWEVQYIGNADVGFESHSILGKWDAPYNMNMATIENEDGEFQPTNVASYEIIENQAPTGDNAAYSTNKKSRDHYAQMSRWSEILWWGSVMNWNWKHPKMHVRPRKVRNGSPTRARRRRAALCFRSYGAARRDATAAQH